MAGRQGGTETVNLRVPAQRPESYEAFTAYDAAFFRVLGPSPTLTRVADLDAHEGPVYFPAEDSLYVTTLPRTRRGGQGLPGPYAEVKRIRLDGGPFPVGGDRVGALDAPLTMPNGMTRGRDGTFVVCEQGDGTHPARISRLDPAAGTVLTLVDNWHGLPLNSPNDVVVRSDGSVWFTDPSYGYLQGFRPEPAVGDFVYRYDPRTGALDVVTDELDKPNGIAFSPDDSVLYLTDSGANQAGGSYHVDRPHHVLAFDVVGGGRHLTNRRLLAVVTPGIPDGITVDEQGRVYVSSDSGVQVFTPHGDLLGRIDLPGAVNFTFGGAERNVLFITTDAAVWAAVLDVAGVEIGIESKGA